MKKHLLLITFPLLNLISCQNKPVEDSNNINEDTIKKSYIDIIKEDLGATNVSVSFESSETKGYITTMEIDHNKVHSVTKNGDTLMSDSFMDYQIDKTVWYGTTSNNGLYSIQETNQGRTSEYSLLSSLNENSPIFKTFFDNMEDLLKEVGNGIYKATDCLEMSLESDSPYIKNLIDEGYSYSVKDGIMKKIEGTYVEFEIRDNHLYRFQIGEYGMGGYFDSSTKEAEIFIKEDLTETTYYNFRVFGSTVVTLPIVQ